MTNYTKATNFTAKDSLLTGNPSKLVKGTEIDAEFTAISTAIGSKYDSSTVTPIANGGTGSSTAATARTALGSTTVGDAVFVAVDAATARTALGAQASGSYATSGAATASGLTLSTGKILGRTTASTGAIEEITPGASLTLASGALGVATGGVTPTMLSQPPTLGSTASTSGAASYSISGIPSWAKKITVMINSVTTNGSSGWRLQLGTGGSATTSGYDGATGRVYAGGPSATASASGFDFNADSALFIFSGVITLHHMGSNLWVASGVVGSSANVVMTITLGGKLQLAGVLDYLRIISINGSDTFDGGSWNILVE